ncbi:MAG: gamma-glutamyltransferase [Gammaproteobacteria bacterium]
MRLLILLLCATLPGCGPPGPPVTPPAARQAEAERFMVSAAHPLAVEAGVDILRRGGNAVDAAVAVQMMLGFVEAPETGIGGGGFLLYRDAARGTVEVFDGRETAPAAARPDRFTLFGLPVPRWVAIPSGRSVGVPGLVAMLGLAHDRHGSLPWATLLQPAIAATEQGLPMPGRLARESRGDPSLRLFADTRRAFVAPAGATEPVLRSEAYAATLRTLAREGPRAFYEGPIAASVVERARARRPWRSDLEVSDLRDYRAIERAALCGRYRQWTVCGAPPPSSGGIAILQALGVLEHFPVAELGPGSVEAIHLLAEAQRLAFADRERYLGDPAFVDVPTDALIDPTYLSRRAALIDPRRAMRSAPHGDPAGARVRGAGDAVPAAPAGGTSHFSVVDAEGNAVALTASIETPFGSRMTSDGFLLNNQLTDFSFTPRAGGLPHPNAVAPGKRPRSSMSPVIVLDTQGEVRLVVGARGGPRIIAYVLKVLVGVLDWDLGIQEAIELPNFTHLAGRLELERGSRLAARGVELEALGHRVRQAELTSGLHGIEATAAGWRGGADPRLEGVARGE